MHYYRVAAIIISLHFHICYLTLRYKFLYRIHTCLISEKEYLKSDTRNSQETSAIFNVW
jgi:hypothetical protein